MNLTEEKLSNLNPVITLTVTQEDYLPIVNASLKKHSKQATIKGFRPGTVPAGIIKKMYGNSILAEELNKIIESQLELHLKPFQDQLIGQPIPRTTENDNEIDINSTKDYVFSFEYGIRPDFTISLTDKIFEKQKVTIDKASVEKEVTRILKKFGAVAEVDEIKNQEDLVYISIKEIAPEKETPHEHDTIISVQDIISSKQENWMTKKVGNQMTENPFELFDNQKINVAKFILNLTEEQKATISPNFSFEITKVTQHVPAEMNEELFKKATGLEDITTAEGFEAHVEKEIASYYNKQSENKLGQDIFTYLIENTAMELPLEFLKRYLQKVSTNKLEDPIEIDQQFTSFSKELKWDLISSKIANDNDVKIEIEEIQNEIRNQFINQLHQYGMTYYTDEMLKNFVDKAMQDRKQVQQTYDILLDYRILEILKSSITPIDKTITEEAFVMDSKERQEKMQRDRENATNVFDTPIEETTAIEESSSNETSIMGNIKNLASNLFKSNK